MTFYGLGYHEYRERWFTNEWYWHQSNPLPSLVKYRIPKDEANEIIQQRVESITPYLEEGKQTRRGWLFEMLAEMTDEDGALADLQDLGDLADWLGDNDEP